MRRRSLIAFGFGLVHGFGFANVLRELDLPRASLGWSLLAFNVGVEFGQLAVILLAFLAVAWFRDRPWYRPWIVIPASCLIAIIVPAFAGVIFWKQAIAQFDRKMGRPLRTGSRARGRHPHGTR